MQNFSSQLQRRHRPWLLLWVIFIRGNWLEWFTDAEVLEHGCRYVLSLLLLSEGVLLTKSFSCFALQLALTVVSPWQWFCSTRTFSNGLETTLTVIALSLWPWRWSDQHGQTEVWGKEVTVSR